MIHPNDPPPRVKYEIRVMFKSNEAPWSGGYDPSPYGPKNDGEAVEWAVRMQEGLGDMYAVTLTRDGVVMPLPEPPTNVDEDDGDHRFSKESYF